MKNSDVATINSSGADLKSALKVTFGVGRGSASTNVSKDTAQKDQLKDFHYETETLIMGGRVPSDVSDPDSMADWSDSVEELPMPVREKLPLKFRLIPIAAYSQMHNASNTKRGFLIQCVAGIGTKGCWNTKYVVFDKGIRCRIPRSITTGFKGCS